VFSIEASEKIPLMFFRSAAGTPREAVYAYPASGCIVAGDLPFKNKRLFLNGSTI